MAKQETPTIKDPTIIRDLRGSHDYPAAVFKGVAPEDGSKVVVILEGLSYTGIVHSSGQFNGTTTVLFREGLSPVN